MKPRYFHAAWIFLIPTLACADEGRQAVAFVTGTPILYRDVACTTLRPGDPNIAQDPSCHTIEESALARKLLQRLVEFAAAHYEVEPSAAAVSELERRMSEIESSRQEIGRSMTRLHQLALRVSKGEPIERVAEEMNLSLSDAHHMLKVAQGMTNEQAEALLRDDPATRFLETMRRNETQKLRLRAIADAIRDGRLGGPTDRPLAEREAAFWDELKRKAELEVVDPRFERERFEFEGSLFHGERTISIDHRND